MPPDPHDLTELRAELLDLVMREISIIEDREPTDAAEALSALRQNLVSAWVEYERWPE